MKIFWKSRGNQERPERSEVFLLISADYQNMSPYLVDYYGNPRQRGPSRVLCSRQSLLSLLCRLNSHFQHCFLIILLKMLYFSSKLDSLFCSVVTNCTTWAVRKIFEWNQLLKLPTLCLLVLTWAWLDSKCSILSIVIPFWEIQISFPFCRTRCNFGW